MATGLGARPAQLHSARAETLVSSNLRILNDLAVVVMFRHYAGIAVHEAMTAVTELAGLVEATPCITCKRERVRHDVLRLNA